MITAYIPGSIVACRDRQWVVLPSDIKNIVRLRPLSGNEDETETEKASDINPTSV